MRKNFQNIFKTKKFFYYISMKKQLKFYSIFEGEI